MNGAAILQNLQPPPAVRDKPPTSNLKPETSNLKPLKLIPHKQHNKVIPWV
jgi:hypothetical protein